MSPTPPTGPLDLLEWSNRTTSSPFVVYSESTEQLPNGRIRRERVIYRPYQKGDNDRIRRAGYRWARIRRIEQPDHVPYTPQPPANIPPSPVPQLVTTPSGSIFGAAAAGQPIYGPDAPNVQGYLSGLVNQVVTQLPQQLLQPVQKVLDSVLGTTPNAPSSTTPPAYPPTIIQEQPGEETEDHTVRNVLILLGGVGVVAFLVARFARK